MFVSIICDINDKRAEFSLARAFALDFVARSFVAYILPCGFVWFSSLLKPCGLICFVNIEFDSNVIEFWGFICGRFCLHLCCLFQRLRIYSAYISRIGSAYSFLGWCCLLARALLLNGCSFGLRDGSYSESLTCEDEPTRHGRGDLILLHAMEDCRLLWSLSLYLLAVVWVYLECQAEGCAVLVFDLADVAKALVQFEWSSDASQEATA
jgi:hypothetical protein